MFDKKLFGKKFIQSDLDDFVYFVNCLDEQYTLFLKELKNCEYDYSYGCSQNIKVEAKEKLDYMLQKKKEYRAEFEDIYNRFKSIKGVEIPNRNAILNKMRKSFDFDSSKYYAENVSSR